MRTMRMLSTRLALVSGLSLIALHAAVAQVEPPARGFAIWARIPGASIQDLVGSASGAPRFAVGYRGDRVTFGGGLGMVAFRSSDRNAFGGQTTEDKVTGTLFQVGPSMLIDVWRSADRRTRGNIAAGIALGRLSINDQNQFLGFPGGGVQTTTTKTTGTLLGFHAGLGGDHFFDPHFALGLEVGLQWTTAGNIKEEGTAERVGLGANGTYSAIRATVVF